MDGQPVWDNYQAEVKQVATALIARVHFILLSRSTVCIISHAHVCALKVPLPREGSGRSSNTRFLGPTQVPTLNGTLIGSATFAGLTAASNRHKQTVLRL